MVDSIDDVVRALRDTSPFNAAPGAPLDITPQAQAAAPGPPLVITPTLATPSRTRGDDFALPVPVMTPPPVTPVPFVSTRPRAAPPVMGDVLGAPPTPQDRPRYIPLPTYV